MENFIGFFDPNVIAKEQLKSEMTELSGSSNILTSKSVTGAEKDGASIYILGEIYSLEGSKIEIAKKILDEYLHTGEDAFKTLDGEFTIIILKPDSSIIYRDRHGAGPQVYFNDEMFTMHLKNFSLLKDFKAEPNTEALFTFLSIGYVPSPMCSLKGVSKLPAGSVIKARNQNQLVESLNTWEEYFARCSNPEKISIEEATLKYEELHKKSLRDRVKDKSKVGLLLSGGYDSGGNIAGLRDVYSGDAFSYSIGFKDNPWTELPLAKVLSEKFETKHSEYEIDGTEILDLPEIVSYLGDPFQEGGLMVNYTAMKLIGDNKPEIILGGDGNDQHFGTAGKELAMHWEFKRKGYAGFQKLYADFGKLPMFNKDNIFFRTQFHNEKIRNIQQSDNFGFKAHDLKRLSNDNLKFGQHKYLESVPKKFNSFDEFYFVHNYFGDIKQVINEVILFKASKMASLFGNSLTFPYMSTEIYNFLDGMPRDYKCKGSVYDLSKGKGITKFLHKNYLKPKLPSEITDRKKQGGFAPLPIFFKDDKQRNRLSEFIMHSDVTRELFSEKYLNKFFKAYDENVKGGGYWFWYKQVKAFQFFNLLVMAVWWETFINQKDIKLS